jgi:hypothetical protein
MATTDKPALVGQTKENNIKGVTDVSLVAQRKVTYVFKATTAKNLSIPYAVAIDGVISATFAKKPLRVSGENGKITVSVKQGQRVHLHLNSDAHPEFRTQAVYAVTAGDRDILIKITEKVGKHTDSDTPTKVVDADAIKEAAKTEDTYIAALTGDIWMKVSHKYTAAEAEARLPATASAAVRSAVASIYAGLKKNVLEITEPAAADAPARTLKVLFADSGNPKNNITNYELLADGVTRVHPAGYESLFTSALRQGITSMTLSSCWRPMIGSIAHRAGLGLDVSWLGGTNLNREELRVPKKRKEGAGNDKDNVTDAEVKAFDEYEQALVTTKKAEAEKKAAETALAAAKKSGDAAATEAAQQRATAAGKALGKAQEEIPNKLDAWNNARDAGEPAHARQFRVALLKCVCVRQLFDPWFMDANTKDSTEPEPNMQKSDNETLHAHHLHITVDDPKIL